MADRPTHSHIDPSLAESAKRGSAPDVEIYQTPASPRESSANLWLSGIILALALIVAIWLLWAFMT